MRVLLIEDDAETAAYLLNARHSDKFEALMAFQVARAGTVYDEAFALLPKQDRRAFVNIPPDRLQRLLHPLRRLLGANQIGIEHTEKFGIELERLLKHLAPRHFPVQHGLDPGQRLHRF